MSGPVLRPALFLDRDGVINHEVGYLHRIADVRWVEGIQSLCRTARSLGYVIVVVTNQSGIARGLYTEADFHTLMRWMRAELERDGAHFDAVYFCPVHPEFPNPAYPDSDERKPGPGMLLRAAREHGLDVRRSLMVGDRCSDMAAAAAAGVPVTFLLGATEAGACTEPHRAITTLGEVEAWLRSQ